MFDTHIHKHTQHVAVPYEKSVTVHEHKAPTDESLRMLDEMRDKAYQSILDTIVIDNNSLNLKAIVYQDYVEDCTRVKYNLQINGHTIAGTATMVNYTGVQAMVERLVNAASGKIAEELLLLVAKENRNIFK